MANISAIKLPSGTTYNIKDKNALPLTGGQVTGPVTFGDTVSIDEATVGDLVVNGSASFTNNIQANTISGDLTGDVTGNVVGNVSGSAGTAGAFTSAKSVTLTGDVTGSASSTGGWSIATTVKDDSHNHTASTLSGVALSTDVLTKTNTTSYTPTANYHPATKKYVDDNANNLLVVNFTYSSGNDFTADKSYSDITTAYNAGKIVYGKTPEFSCIYTSGYFRSVGAETDEDGYRIFYYMTYVSGNTWTRDYLDATSPILSLSGNTLQLKQGNTIISTVNLPIYNGGVS